ncbi:N-succinylarginine dihydrolase [Klebsiella pneumoniae subsp. pneumoniae]|nr:N-succinylarginine dihydrolase [Klebsiella pneumoniae subsp. pneumoniae]
MFNSQLLSKPDGKMLIVVPEECRQRENVWRYLSDLAADSASPIDEVAVFDLRKACATAAARPVCGCEWCSTRRSARRSTPIA